MRMRNSFRAHQPIDRAQESGTAHAAMMALFAAFFTRCENVSNIDVLIWVTEKIGLDGTAARAMLESGSHAEAVREKDRFWTERGVQGVPAMIFKRENVVTGAQGKDTYASVPRKLKAPEAA